MKKKIKKLEKIIIIIFSIITAIYSYFNLGTENETSYEMSNIPEYSGKAYIEINNNIPNFTDEDMNLEKDYYSTLKNGKVRNGNSKNLLGKSK